MFFLLDGGRQEEEMPYRAGDISPEAGVYRCTNCGAEVRLTTGETFPPCDCGQASWNVVRRAREREERGERAAS
jgi:predicted RNA-binding Zn-ribbon protein involved in translation (DUF1610 family)